MAGNTLNELREEFESFLRQDVSIGRERGLDGLLVHDYS
jgi:hypothetical protein